MEPERVRAYLQVACAGLGFDIGEIWWTSGHHNESSPPSSPTPFEGEFTTSLKIVGICVSRVVRLEKTALT